RADVTAYGLFLEARDLIYTRKPANMERALELLNSAIEIDANYAPAYAARAKAVTLLSDRPGSYGKLPAKESLERAEKDVEQALLLDPALSDAYAVQGLINSDTGRPDFAVTSLRRAIELNPNSLDARNWLALALANDGRLRDVAAQLQKLVEIDPLYGPGVNNAIQYSVMIGDKEAARRVAQRFIDTSNNSMRVQDIKVDLLWQVENKFAEAIKLRESLPETEANSATDGSLRFGYYGLGIEEEYEGPAKLQTVFQPWEPLRQGYYDAAVTMAREAVKENPDYYGAHSVYIKVLSETKRDEELADYFAEEYGSDLEDYATKLRPGVNVELPPYLELAQAMRTIGREGLYSEAVQRFRYGLDIFRAGGDQSVGRDLAEAAYWCVVGDNDKALRFLEEAMTKRTQLRVDEFTLRFYEPLRDDPRFLRLRDTNLERVNEERATLGYKPLTAAYYDFEYPVAPSRG
ncbi:MAG: adenylyl cyclase, partial [Pseudomonadota bacterium]